MFHFSVLREGHSLLTDETGIEGPSCLLAHLMHWVFRATSAGLYGKFSPQFSSTNKASGGLDFEHVKLDLKFPQSILSSSTSIVTTS